MSTTALVSPAALDKTSGPAQKMTCEGNAKPNATSDAPSPADRPRPTPEPTPELSSHSEEQDCSRQCLQTAAAPGLSPAPAPANPVTNSDVSEESVLSTRLKLKSLTRKADHLQIAIWIIGSDFLRLQSLEPIVGDASMNYPPLVDDYGLKGQSIYTAFFEHLDMEVFVCWGCGHAVEDDLEGAIAHQRTMHFRHEPYRCHALNGTCEHRFASPSMLHTHQISVGH